MCELFVVVCFCLVEFSFASFFLGLGVTLFSPIKSCSSTDTGGVQIFGNSAKQNGILSRLQ